MTYAETLAYLDTFTDYEKTLPKNYSAELSLERIEALLAKIGNPHRSYPSLHIAGTKGKGSTAAFTASILRTAGLRVGLYTSPHLSTIRERIQVDGAPISEAGFSETVSVARTAVSMGTTFFDATTAAAFLHFQRAKVDVAVVEVGLGGRLDSTNVLVPVVTAVTPVSLDHMDLLG